MIKNIKKLIRPVLAERFAISVFFSCVTAWGHAYLFDIRVNSRMVLQPWLLQNGFVQYQHIADEHAPLLPQLLAWLLPIFGNDALLTARVAHAFLICFTVFASVLWVYNASGRWAAIATGAFFLAWSSSLGYWAMWYELAVGPLFIGLFFILSRDAQENLKRLAIAGLITGVAILLKQQAAILILAIPIWFIMQRLMGKKIVARQTVYLNIAYFCGMVAPMVIYTIYYYSQAGALHDLLYWPLYFNLINDYQSLGRLSPTLLQVHHALPAFLMAIPFGASVIAFQKEENLTPSSR